MNAYDLVSQLRDLYVKQFASFVASRRAFGGGAEVQFMLSEHAKVFRRLYRVDWVSAPDGDGVTELDPPSVLTFPEFSITLDGGAEISFIRSRWDRIVLHHDLPDLRPDRLSLWFDRWFDPNEERLDVNAPLAGFIHSLLIEQGAVHVDFGTAPVDAFWDLVDVLAADGAIVLRCCDS